MTTWPTMSRYSRYDVTVSFHGLEREPHRERLERELRSPMSVARSMARRFSADPIKSIVVEGFTNVQTFAAEGGRLTRVSLEDK